MLDRLTGLPLHRFFYITALVLIAIGVCLNKVVMSVGTIMIFSSWVLEGEYKQKWEAIKNNLPFLVGVSIFLLHILGLAWTSNFEYAFHDLRAKLPLITIPFVLGSIPKITKFEFKIVLLAFVSSVLITSILSWMIVKGIIPSSRSYTNFREYSIFISHIRYSLMIVFAIFVMIYFLLKDFRNFYLFIPFVIWLFYYLYFSQSLPAFFYILILFAASAIYLVIKSGNRLLKWSTITFVVLVAGGSLLWLNDIRIQYYDFEMEKAEDHLVQTANGNYYQHDLTSEMRENGTLIYWHICQTEMLNEWPKKSKIDLMTGFDQNGNPIYHTLVRYMAARGLKKDSVGIHSLTEEDIDNIESGITNPLRPRSGLRKRIMDLLDEYELWRHNADPNEKTVMQRLSYWNAGAQIFKDNFLIGVGTGDVQDSFDEFYEKTESKLSKENRHRSHNQYLTFGVTFGIFGLLLFLIYLIYPFVYHGKKTEYLFVIFFTLMFLSFFPEDTLETQSGVSFFALFYSLFLFRKR